MHALVLNQIKQPLDLEQRSDPRPAEDEVLVRLHASALNRRDFWITQGMYPGIETPVILGSDGAGVVTECGKAVDPSWKSREIIINPGIDWGSHQDSQSADFTILGLPRDGTFANMVTVPASQIHDKPEHMSWEQAAALPLAGVTAFRAVFTQGKLRQDETMLITGIGGGVATLALQFGVACGAQVWVTSSAPEKIQRAVEMGAQGGFNYRDEDWADHFVAQAQGANLIIDSAAGKSYSSLLTAAAPGGRIVNYGATTGPPEKLDMFRVFWKQLHLIGSTMGSPDDFADMLSFVNKHSLVPHVDQTFSLRQGNEALACMMQSSQFGKLVLINDEA